MLLLAINLCLPIYDPKMHALSLVYGCMSTLACACIHAMRLQVYLGTLLGSEKVAIKVVPCELNGTHMEQLMQEVAILKACRCSG